MSLANLSVAYEALRTDCSALRLKTRMAEEQLDDFSRLLASWFVDSDPAARDWLREVAQLYRQEHPAPTAEERAA